MDPFYSLTNPSDVLGLDINCSDGDSPPETTGLTRDELPTWFTGWPEDSLAALRILSHHVPRTSKDVDVRPPPVSKKVPFTQDVVNHAMWKPDVYRDLAKTRAGGGVAMRDEPYRFMLQTPYDDDGPFCSLALSRHGSIVKGIFVYNDDIFEPLSILENERLMSGWRGSGMQIITLPQAVVKAQAAWIASRLSAITATVSSIERILAEQPAAGSARNFSSLSRTLQSSGASLIDLERRSRFETQVLNSIEVITTVAHHGTTPWPALAPLRSQIASREYEFETLPRRIENARATITNLVQQHNDQMNFETAESSRRIAEATLSESASMKAIAVLTMIFLPGTAVASFFSMAMFDWNANSGSHLASKWIWIYFVVAIPLTGAVLGLWWVYSNRMRRHTERLHGFRRNGVSPFDDGEAGRSQQVEIDELEMQDVEVNNTVAYKGISNL